jgi:hypothetical protein
MLFGFSRRSREKPNNIFPGGSEAAPEPLPKLTLQQPWIEFKEWYTNANSWYL